MILFNNLPKRTSLHLVRQSLIFQIFGSSPCPRLRHRLPDKHRRPIPAWDPIGRLAIFGVSDGWRSARATLRASPTAISYRLKRDLSGLEVISFPISDLLYVFKISSACPTGGEPAPISHRAMIDRTGFYRSFFVHEMIDRTGVNRSCAGSAKAMRAVDTQTRETQNRKTVSHRQVQIPIAEFGLKHPPVSTRAIRSIELLGIRFPEIWDFL